MGDRPVTIRLLDPPLHEFLPHTDEEIKALCRSRSAYLMKNWPKKTQKIFTSSTRCWVTEDAVLAVTYPEIAEMQAEAIIMAAIEVRKEQGYGHRSGNHDPAGRHEKRTG